MHQLPDNTAEAVDKPLIPLFQLGNGLLFLRRDIGGFLEEAPTQLPQRLSEFNTVLIVLCFPICLELPAGG